MKRKVLVLVVVAIGFCTTQANAQGLGNFLKKRLTGGLKLEGSGTSFMLSDMPGTKSEMGFGGTFGGFVKLNLSKNLLFKKISYSLILLQN